MKGLRPDSVAMGALLTALVAFGPMSTDMYLPSLPTMTEAFATDVGRVQLTLSVFLVGFALAQLIVGPVSDRFGRRPVLLGGLTLYTVASLGCVLAPSIEVLIGARFVQALGACTGAVLGRATVRDIHGPEQAARVMAYMGSAMALAPMIAPMVGGYLVVWAGWQSVFWVLIGFGGLLFVLVVLGLDETNRHKDPLATDPRRMAANYLTLLRNPLYRGYMLTIAFVFAGLFSFISGSSFVLIGIFGLEPHVFGLSFGTVVAGYAVGSIASGKLTLKTGIEPLVRKGAWTAAVAGMVLVAFVATGIQTVATIIAPMAAFMIGVGLVLPNALAGAIGPFPRMAGAASALIGFVQMAVASVAGFLVGHLHDGTALPMTGVIAAMAMATLGCYLGLVRPNLPPRKSG